jgi:hypothetical protein
MRRRRTIILLATVVAIPACAFLLAWRIANRPVMLYGRVVDASGQPVPNAEVSAVITGRPVIPPFPALWATDRIASETVTATTDDQGRFVIRGHGKSISLGHVTPAGEDTCTFERFYRFDGTSPFRADPVTPEIFRLQPAPAKVHVQHGT